MRSHVREEKSRLAPIAFRTDDADYAFPHLRINPLTNGKEPTAKPG
jgi:hypothetical protein